MREDKRTHDIAHAVKGLGQVQTHGLVLLVTQLGDVGVAVGLQGGGASCNHEHGKKKDVVGCGIGGGHRDERTQHEKREAHNDAAFVAKLLCHDRGGNCHHEIGTIVGDLQQARLGTRKLEVVGHRAVEGVDQVHGQAPYKEK